jgi:FtsP/CotA-like multicopper oxidase with cupredoxin domain
MNTRPVNIHRILVPLILATATTLCGLGLSFVNSESDGVRDRFFAGQTGAPTGTHTAIATPTPTPFSHPLLFPPVATEANVSIGIDEACVQILDGPCTNMWTYGGTYPGLTIRRSTGHRTKVTFTNNLNPAAGELTVHNHGNHSTTENDGQPEDS